VLNPRVGANMRMRDLIVNNFLKKYLASQEGEQVSSLNYSRLQRAVTEHVDEYLSKSTTRSVKMLEDQLWAITKRYSGKNRQGLPQIDLNSSMVIQSNNRSQGLPLFKQH